MPRPQAVEHRFEHPSFRISCEQRPRGFEGPQRACHPDALELSVVDSGVERVQLGTTFMTASTGCYSLIHPGVVHASWVGDRPVVETNLHFQTPWLEALLDECRLDRNQRWRTGVFTAPPELVDSARLVRKAVTGPDEPAKDLMISSLVTFLAGLLLRMEDRDARPALPDTVGSRLQRTEAWMRECPGDRFTIEQLARCAGMSQFHYLRSFKKQYGTSPYAFLLQVRVERASKLIRDTDTPFTRIAMDMGFGSSSRLTEAVRKSFGQTPTELRRSAQGTTAALSTPSRTNRRIRKGLEQHP